MYQIPWQEAVLSPRGEGPVFTESCAEGQIIERQLIINVVSEQGIAFERKRNPQVEGRERVTGVRLRRGPSDPEPGDEGARRNCQSTRHTPCFQDRTSCLLEAQMEDCGSGRGAASCPLFTS